MKMKIISTYRIVRDEEDEEEEANEGSDDQLHGGVSGDGGHRIPPSAIQHTVPRRIASISKPVRLRFHRRRRRRRPRG